MASQAEESRRIRLQPTSAVTLQPELTRGQVALTASSVMTVLSPGPQPLASEAPDVISFPVFLSSVLSSSFLSPPSFFSSPPSCPPSPQCESRHGSESLTPKALSLPTSPHGEIQHAATPVERDGALSEGQCEGWRGGSAASVICDVSRGSKPGAKGFQLFGEWELT
eukprot:3936497-Rhodomonas_salina.1